jgi:hypothetical protein
LLFGRICLARPKLSRRRMLKLHLLFRFCTPLALRGGQLFWIF